MHPYLDVWTVREVSSDWSVSVAYATKTCTPSGKLTTVGYSTVDNSTILRPLLVKIRANGFWDIYELASVFETRSFTPLFMQPMGQTRPLRLPLLTVPIAGVLQKPMSTVTGTRSWLCSCCWASRPGSAAAAGKRSSRRKQPMLPCCRWRDRRAR